MSLSKKVCNAFWGYLQSNAQQRISSLTGRGNVPTPTFDTRNKAWKQENKEKGSTTAITGWAEKVLYLVQILQKQNGFKELFDDKMTHLLEDKRQPPLLSVFGLKLVSGQQSIWARAAMAIIVDCRYHRILSVGDEFCWLTRMKIGLGRSLMGLIRRNRPHLAF